MSQWLSVVSCLRQTKRAGVGLGFLLAITLLLGGCSQPVDNRLTHEMTLVLGEHISDIDRGKLVVYLFAYDPYLADAPADELNKRELPFQHRQGERTTLSVTLWGEVPNGYRTYVSVRGFEQVGEEWRYILWDGQTQTGMPMSLEMQLVP